MKKLLATLLLAVLPSLFSPRVTLAQRTVFFGQNTHTSSLSCNGTDSFTGAGIPLNGCWTTAPASGYGTCGANSGAEVLTGTKCIAAYTGTSHTTTQAAKFVMPSSLANVTTGPCILMQNTGTGYCWFIGLNEVFALSAGAGVAPLVGSSCPTPTAGQTITLSATVTTGVPTVVCTSPSGSGSEVDANLCSGSPCSITGNQGMLIFSPDQLLMFSDH